METTTKKLDPRSSTPEINDNGSFEIQKENEKETNEGKRNGGGKVKRKTKIREIGGVGKVKGKWEERSVRLGAAAKSKVGEPGFQIN